MPMDNLLKDIRAAIEAAAAKEQGLPAWQAAQEIAVNCEVAARWVEMYEMGRPADAILTDLAREQEKAWEVLKGETESYRANARNNPEFPDGMFSVKCAAIALPIIARYIERMEREKGPRRDRLELAQRLAKEVVGQYPHTEIFGGEQSVRQAHFPILEEAYRGYARLKADSFSEDAFREKLRAKLEALEADTAEKLRLYNPEEARPFTGAIGLPEGFHEERQPERLNYLMALFRNTLIARYLTALFPGDGQPESQPAAYGEALATVVRGALEKRRLLDGGKFAGQTSPHVKALFAVLRQKGYLPKKSRIQAARMLSSLFASEFGFEFAPRTVSTAEDEKNEAQAAEETKFLKAIPPRK